MWQSLILYFSRATSLDNRISDLQRDELQSLSGSLKSLDLSGNSLTSVPEGIFWNLQRLEILKLARNNIIQIHSMAFQNGVSSSLILAKFFKVFWISHVVSKLAKFDRDFTSWSFFLFQPIYSFPFLLYNFRGKVHIF